jgi:MFS family permease
MIHALTASKPPDIGVFILAFGMQIGTQALQAYVIDSYPDHTSSATAAGQFVRSMTAFSFPLFAPKMYSSLGYGWGNSLLALIAVGIGLPAPMLLWKHGYKLRMRAQSSY